MNSDRIVVATSFLLTTQERLMDFKNLFGYMAYWPFGRFQTFGRFYCPIIFLIFISRHYKVSKLAAQSSSCQHGKYAPANFELTAWCATTIPRHLHMLSEAGASGDENEQHLLAVRGDVLERPDTPENPYHSSSWRRNNSRSRWKLNRATLYWNRFPRSAWHAAFHRFSKAQIWG